MSNLNTVHLQGNLVDDPKLMGTEEHRAARFTLAVNMGYGEHKDTAFVDCVAFGKQSEVLCEHVKKGKQIIVRGQLTQNRWEDKETGAKRSKLEVRLENVNGFFFVSGGKSGVEANPEEQEAVATATTAPAKGKSKATDGDGKLF